MYTLAGFLPSGFLPNGFLAIVENPKVSSNYMMLTMEPCRDAISWSIKQELYSEYLILVV